MSSEATGPDPLPTERYDARPYVAWQLYILGAMYLGYAAFMLCRNTLIASSAEMIQDPSLDLDKESFGYLMSWHSAGAILGKLVTGPGADILGGRRMFLLALSATAMANVGFAFGSSFFTFAAFNFLGQFAKAGGWPAMTKIVGDWYPESRYGQVWSVISTSSRVGTIAAGVFLGYLLSLVSWRWVFIVSAVVTTVVVAVLFMILKDQPSEVGVSLDETGDDPHDLDSMASESLVPIQPSEHPLDSMTLLQACGAFLRSGRCWAICFSLVFLTIVMDFLTFIPIYLSETSGMSPSTASMVGSCFPAGMFVALIANSYFYDRLSKRMLVVVLGSLLVTSCLCVLSLWRIDLLPASIRTPASIASIFVLGFSISPAYYVPMSVFAVAYGGKHSGFLVALIDVFGYGGALLFNLFGGSIAEHYGWTAFLSGLLAITILATLCMVTFLTLDWRASKKRSLESPFV